MLDITKFSPRPGPPPPALTKLCPTCGVRFPDADVFCPHDGAGLMGTTGSGSLTGRLIADRFLVGEQLGEGGMGTVYRAEQVRMRRPVALKVLRADVAADAKLVARFHREAFSASRVTHPNVAATYEFGETTDGLLYIAMELITGSSLAAVLAHEGALPALRTTHVLLQIAEALAAAEEAGVVHRDLKPDNVMLSRRRDGSDLVKVVDFGIAKPLDWRGQTVTATGMVIGTPAYMSPEQLIGAKDVDARSDQYALALIAYELFTGRRAFDAHSFGEALYRLTFPAPPLAARRPEVAWPPGLQAALERALQTDRAARFERSMDFALAVAAEVQQWTGEALPSLRLTPVYGATPVASMPGVPAAPGAEPSVRDTREARGTRWRVLAGVSAVAVLAAVGAGMARARGSHGHEPPALAPRTTAPVGAPTAVDASPTTGPAASAARSAPRPVAPRSVPAPVGALPTSGAGSATATPNLDPGAQSTGAPITPPAASSPPPAAPDASMRGELDRLRGVARLDPPDPERARSALAAFPALMARLTTSVDSVEATYHAAEIAYAQLEDAAQACRLLHSVERQAVGTPFARAVALYLAPESPFRCR